MPNIVSVQDLQQDKRKIQIKKTKKKKDLFFQSVFSMFYNNSTLNITFHSLAYDRNLCDVCNYVPNQFPLNCFATSMMIELF